MKINSATRAQITASDARFSSWLTANAGSGKTKVLIDRVARLLLDGVQPEQIPVSYTHLTLPTNREV